MDTDTMQEKKKGLSGSTLKLVAIVSMFIDHFAAIILDRYLISIGIMNLNQENILLPENRTMLIIYGIDMIMRLIGRLGFPLFCFLLIEGYYHTRSKAKYGIRLAMFSLISEIPFDLGFKSQVLEFTYQNVFFTLFFGFMTVWGIDAFCTWVGKKIQGKIRLVPCIRGIVKNRLCFHWRYNHCPYVSSASKIQGGLYGAGVSGADCQNARRVYQFCGCSVGSKI